MTISNSTPIAKEDKGFKFGQAGDGEAKSVQQVGKLDTYLVAYKDGEGKNQVRIAFRLSGANETFIINARISGSNVVTTAHPWFHKALVGKLQALGLDEAGSDDLESI